MKKSTIWLLTIVMACAFLGLIYVQMRYMENMVKMRNEQFSEMVKRCYKSRPWHENANIIYLHRDNKKTTILPHACYNLDEAEENMIFNLLKKQLN